MFISLNMLREFLKLVAIYTLGVTLAFSIGYFGLVQLMPPQETQAQIGGGGVSTAVPFRNSAGNWIPTISTYQLGSTTSDWAGIFADYMYVSGGFNLAGNVVDDDVLSFGSGNDYSFCYDSTTDTLQTIDGATCGSSVRMVIDSSGNVGIGIAAPDSRLYVYDNTASSDETVFIKQDNTGATGAALSVRQDGTGDILLLRNSLTGVFVVKDSGDVGAGTSTPSTFFVVGTTTEQFVVDRTGNVGIGTASPDANLEIETSLQSKLHLDAATGAFLDIDRGTTSNGGSLVFSTDGTDTFALGHDNDATSNFYIGDDGAFSNKWLTIDTSGNVGIATTTPAVEFDVAGDIRAYKTSTSTCDASLYGAIFYNQTDDFFYGCKVAGWTRLDN